MDGKLFVIIIAVVAVALIVSRINVYRIDKQYIKSSDLLTSQTNALWGSLIPSEQEQFEKLDTFVEQEAWIEERLPAESGVKAEKVIVELANRGLIVMGLGNSRRNNNVFDLPLVASTKDIPQKSAGAVVQGNVKPAFRYKTSVRASKSLQKKKGSHKTTSKAKTQGSRRVL